MSIEVIIPVQNMAAHLDEALPPLLAQLVADDSITVVDDASTDDTAERARALGANVVSTMSSRGPYYARQLAANRSSAEILLFVDGRCRALPGLLASHRALQANEGTVLSCTAVTAVAGRSLATRVAAYQQPFKLAGKIGVPGRLDFYPTANLGVRRAAFEAVGGFRSMRSGADADICWRIQQEKVGSLEADPEVLMQWIPRSSMRDLFSQWHRYGQSTAYLEWVFQDQSPSSSGKPLNLARRVLDRRRSEHQDGAASVRATPIVRAASAAVSVVYQAGYRSARSHSDAFGAPVHYSPESGT